MDDSPAMRHKNFLFAALGDLIRQGPKSLVVVLCLTAFMFPLVTALGISEGLRFQAEIAVREGADLYVSGDLFGGNAPISLSLRESLAALPEVSSATARVVGRTYFADRLVAVVGLDEKGLLALKPLVRGEVPQAKGEVVVGEGIVKAFGVRPGPGMRFTLSANHRKVFVPTATLLPSCLWSSEILIMHLEDANEFFRVDGLAGQVLLYGTFDSGKAFSEAIQGVESRELLRLDARPELEEKVRVSYGHRGGVYVVLFIIGAALFLPAFLVTSGFGLREIQREMGLLKALGWRTRDVLEKVIFQNILISLTAACFSILFSMAWIKGFNGAFIAQFYIAEVGLFPDFEVPSRYVPAHALFCLGLSLAATLPGSVLSTWKRARTAPGELMR